LNSSGHRDYRDPGGDAFPALNQAKEKANRVSCLNNLRQVGIFMQFYTDENRDTFPAHRNQNLPTDDATPP